MTSEIECKVTHSSSFGEGSGEDVEKAVGHHLLPSLNLSPPAHLTQSAYLVLNLTPLGRKDKEHVCRTWSDTLNGHMTY